MSASVGITLALELVVALLAKSTEISLLIQQAKAQGRDTLTAEEWASIEAKDSAARQALVEAIAKAKAAGR